MIDVRKYWTQCRLHDQNPRRSNEGGMNMKHYSVIKAPVYEVIILAETEAEAIKKAGQLPITAFNMVEDFIEAEVIFDDDITPEED
jgi:hypothetical protein